jgi:hypothetical protein
MAADLEIARELVHPACVVEPDGARHEFYRGFISRATKLLAMTKTVPGQVALGAVEPTQLGPRA